MTPILVHVGYHGTVSSWLRDVFFEDPATGYRRLGGQSLAERFVRDGALEFDADAVRAQFEPPVAEARAADLVPVISCPRLSGHPYSGGYDSKELADRLHAVWPEARILIVVREQRSAIVSTCKQYVCAGGPSTIHDFLHHAPQQGWRVPAFDFGHFEYDRLLRYYRSLYGTESVLGLPSEQFLADRTGFLSRIARFAGRSVSGDVFERLRAEPRDKECSALAVELTRPLNRFASRSDLNPEPLLGSSLIYPIAKGLRRIGVLNGRIAARSEAWLRETVEEAVGDRYIESNRETASLLGVDLAAYGWMV